MKNFNYQRAQSFAEASEAKKAAKNSAFLAGGTDLLGKLKDDILPEYPETVIDMKHIPGAKGITKAEGKLEIGALTTLKEVSENEDVKAMFPILSEAAVSVASPLIRNMATIGGNICQDVRCWFYRYPHEAAGRLNCARKGGEQCYAIQGENRYHSIFGGYKIAKSQCTRECPAGTDIPAYLAELRKENWDGAAEIIMRVNPMPMITSRICPHPCQDKCNQCSHGDCVNIHCEERAVGDYILENAAKFYQAPAEETGKKVAIIGAGPSGLSAAFYLRKAGHAVTVIDSMEKPGGVLMYGIPHYRLPKDIVTAYADALKGMGVEFVMNTKVGKDITLEEIDAKYDSVFIGTGAWKQPILGISGEEMTQFGLNFLVEVNTYLKKAAQFGENILVCGGGNVAMDVALTACRLGAKNITLVCLEQEYEMPASKEEIARAREEGVKIINGRGLSKVLEENGKVTGLETMKCVSVFDENHRFHPVYDEADKSVIEADTIILATGQRVDLDFLGDFAKDIKSGRGLLDADKETFKTVNPHIYGAGDAVTGPNIAIRAVNGGRAAAFSMSRELGFPIEKAYTEQAVLSYDNKGVMEKVSNKPVELPLESRCLDKEDSQTFTKETAVKEAGRCMDCGCYAVSPSDVAPALIALGATIVTNEREIPACEFSCRSPKVTDVLHDGEIVTKIVIPATAEEAKTQYRKFRLRDSYDFAIVSVASVIAQKEGKVEDAKFVFGGVAPMPRIACEVSEFLKGKEITEETAEEAAALAVKDANPLQYNAYKIVDLKALVKDSILAAK